MELQQLEYLSLVSKISQELSNHVGIADKTLAEFIIEIHNQSSSVEAFQRELDNIDSGLSHTFVENLDRLIRRMHPNHQLKGKRVKVEDDNKKSIFRGLAIPDQPREWDSEERDAKKMRMDVEEMDDTLSRLVGMEKEVKSEKRKREH